MSKIRKWMESVRHRVGLALLGESVSGVYDADEGRWMQLGGGTGYGATGDWQYHLQTLWDQSHSDEWCARALVLYRMNPFFRAAVRAYEKYVVGEGPNIRVEDDVLSATAHDIYASLGGVGWVTEMTRRVVRDGEVFIFLGEGTSRFIDVGRVRTPAQYVSDPAVIRGIRLGDDGTTPEEYYVSTGRPGDTRYDVIPAGDIIHVKDCADANEVRGYSRLECIATDCQWMVEHMQERRTRVRLSNGVYLLRYSSAAGVSAGRSDADGSSSVPKPGSVIRVPHGVKYEYLSSNLEAADAERELRVMRLALCSGVGLPEYFFGDASNSNYASTLVSEGPAMLEFANVRATVDGAVEAVLRELCESQGVSAEGLSVDWPSMEYHDWSAETETKMKLVERGILSPRTLSGELGYDYDMEMEAARTDEANMPGYVLQGLGGAVQVTEHVESCGCGDGDYMARDNIIQSTIRRLREVINKE